MGNAREVKGTQALELRGVCGNNMLVSRFSKNSFIYRKGDSEEIYLGVD